MRISHTNRETTFRHPGQGCLSDGASDVQCPRSEFLATATDAFTLCGDSPHEYVSMSIPNDGSGISAIFEMNLILFRR